MATDAPVHDAAIAADGSGATVLGERTSTGGLLLGEFGGRTIAESIGPVVVVRREAAKP